MRFRVCAYAALLAVAVLPAAAVPATAAPGACTVTPGAPAEVPGGDLVARLVKALLEALGAGRTVTVVCAAGDGGPTTVPGGSAEGGADGTSPSADPSPTTEPAARGASATSAPAAGSASGRPDHVVVVVEENEDAESVLGSNKAPYLDSLAKEGASLTRFTAETHPSQPNYLALFSGDTHGISGDECADPIAAPNLATALTAGARTFVGYSEGLPKAGFTGCTSGRYARKHAPWAAFAGTPAAQNQPWTAWPSDFTQLPDVAFVIPDLCHDMHDCSVTQGDAWLRDNLGAYATWARTHNSLLVVTWDEASTGSPDNRIATVVAGAGVKAGADAETADHYRLLSTIAGLEGVTAPGRAGEVAPLTGWRSGG